MEVLAFFKRNVSSDSTNIPLWSSNKSFYQALPVEIAPYCSWILPTTSCRLPVFSIGIDLAEQTTWHCGLWNIGRAVARRSEAFDMEHYNKRTPLSASERWIYSYLSIDELSSALVSLTFTTH